MTVILPAATALQKKGNITEDVPLCLFEVGKKALDFLIANSGSDTIWRLYFFGGEPLMNWQVVKDLVAYGREQEKIHNKKFRFTLTTNGVLLNDEVMEFCNKEMGNVSSVLMAVRKFTILCAHSAKGQEAMI